jgi:hypothetical protein
VRRVLILLAAVAALTLAGCGGGGGNKPSGPPLTKQAYPAKIQQITKDISAKLGKTTTSKNLSKGDIDKVDKALRTFADQMEGVNPPVEVKQLHVRLIAAIRQLADEFPGIAKALNEAKDPSAAIAALFGAKSIQALAKLQQEFKAKGYNLNLNG